MVFVYTGDEEYFETAKGYTIGNVLEDQVSGHVEYEVPFYLALNSGIDYAHFPFHNFFFQHFFKLFEEFQKKKRFFFM